MGFNCYTVFMLVILVGFCFNDLACSQSSISGNFVLTNHGIGKCPYSGSSAAVSTRSERDCARRCRISDNCIYYSYQRNNKMCHLYVSTPDKLFSIPNCKFMLNTKAFQGPLPLATVRIDPKGCSLPFQHNNIEYNHCIDVIGIDTPQCVTPNGDFADCIVLPGYTATQEVVILTLGTALVPLPCINNWIIMMYRFDGSVAFNRPWADYKKGFGDIRTSEFWIGNDNIHLYTSQPEVSYRVRIEVQCLTSGKWFYAEYEMFSVESEANNYTIHLAGYVGNAGDSLTNTSLGLGWYISGMKFSTSDADNDLKSSGSCVSQYPSGWWFNNCWYACLTCVYSSVNFSWYTLHDYQYENEGRLRAARMMIRRNYP